MVWETRADMVSVPSFLLRRLYVKGSLKNTADGFEFELRNRLGSGYALRVHPLTVDGAEISAGASRFVMEDGATVRFDEVSAANTLTIALNKSIWVRASGARLAPGARKIGMGFDVPGLGTMRFDFTDAALGSPPCSG